jgi:hypothetical protein
MYQTMWKYIAYGIMMRFITNGFHRSAHRHLGGESRLFSHSVSVPILREISKTTYTSGEDERDLEPEQDIAEVIYNISVNIRKMELLTLLMSDKYSQVEKLAHIENHNRVFDDSPYVHDISAGGLYKMWKEDADFE